LSKKTQHVSIIWPLYNITYSFVYLLILFIYVLLHVTSTVHLC